MAIDRRLLTYINWGLVATTLLLFWVGIGNLYSASGVRVEDGISLAPYYERQMIWGAFGLIAMVACMSFDYRHLQAMALPFFLIVLFSLCLIPIFGKVIYGARRWIDLGFFHFQPSEMAKIAVLLIGGAGALAGRRAVVVEEAFSGFVRGRYPCGFHRMPA